MWTTLRRPVRAVFLAFVIVLVVFLGYEVVERTFLEGTDPSTLHVIHIIRGAGTSLLVAAVVSYYLARGLRRPPLTESRGFLVATPAEGAQDLLVERARWLIEIRWVVAITFLVATLGAITVFRPSAERWIALAGVALVLPAGNLLIAWRIQAWTEPVGRIVIQMVFDLLLLTAVLALWGGMRNPATVLYLLHVILAAMLLPRRHSRGVLGVALAGLGTLTVLDATGYVDLTLWTELGWAVTDRPVWVPVSDAVVLGTVILLTGSLVAPLTEALRQKERELRQAAQMAALGEMCGSLAHEINNPITVISTRARMLRDQLARDGGPEAPVRALERIEAHAERIATIVQGLLAYARPSAGPRAPVDVNQIVRDTVALAAARAKTAGVELRTELAEPSPTVSGNPVQLGQVLINLVNNALDATPSGGRVAVRTREEEGVKVIEVEDTGSGIPPEVRDRIFEPFFTTKPVGKGTGLGLPVALGLVRSHGGELLVDSAPGRGTRVLVRLPRA